MLESGLNVLNEKSMKFNHELNDIVMDSNQKLVKYAKSLESELHFCKKYIEELEKNQKLTGLI